MRSNCGRFVGFEYIGRQIDVGVSYLYSQAISSYTQRCGYIQFNDRYLHLMEIRYGVHARVFNLMQTLQKDTTHLSPGISVSTREISASDVCLADFKQTAGSDVSNTVRSHGRCTVCASQRNHTVSATWGMKIHNFTETRNGEKGHVRKEETVRCPTIATSCSL